MGRADRGRRDMTAPPLPAAVPVLACSSIRADRTGKSLDPGAAEPVPASALSQLRPAKSRVSRLQVRLRLLSAGKIRISSDAPRRVLRRDSMITGEKIAGTEEEQ